MMELIHKIFSLLDWKMTTPPSYGWFHILSIILTIIVVILIARSLKENPDRVVKNTLIGFSVIALTLELMKQGLFTHAESSYQWYAFPFQFCSTPMYISLLSILVKNQKIKEALYSFLAFYGLFGGLIVMIYPNDVFTDLVMIDIQTMFHHGGIVVVGATLILADKVKFDLKSFLKASYVFIGLVIMASGLNFIAHNAGIESFNMFFISPYLINHLPVLSTIQQTQHYIIFLISYLFGFGLAAFITQKIGYGLNYLLKYLHINQKGEIETVEVKS